MSVLKRAKTYLKDEGIIYIAVPNAVSIHRQLGLQMGMLSDVFQLNSNDIAFGHIKLYTPQILRDEIRGAGLKLIFEGGNILKPLHESYMEETLSLEQISAFVSLGELYKECAAEIYVIVKK